MTLIADLTALLGRRPCADRRRLAGHTGDWTGNYTADPLAVARPANTAEVSACLRIAATHGVAVVPISGRTGLVGGAMTTRWVDDFDRADEPDPRDSPRGPDRGGRGGRDP